MFKKNTLIVSLAVIAIFMVVMVIISSFSKNNNEVVINLDQPEKSIKNIIFIVADDLGWSDVGYGDPNSDAYTPTIDQLAREGIILDQAYAYPMCTPSRTSLMTGLFAERVGLQHFVIPNSRSLQPIGVPLDIKMFPEYLKEYGFKSHIVGKWHLGSCKMEYTPVHRGFDSFYGYFYGSQNYFTHKSLFLNGTYDDFWYQSRNYLKPIADRTRLYSTLAFNDHITEIIDSHDKTKPLFLYYAAQNPHSDKYFNVPKEFEEKFSYIKNEKRRKILAMINMLDESILNITRDLERNNLLEHTLIVFTSDNGGEISDLHRNYPLRGGKTTVFEGGQRVRSFIYGKDLDIKPFVYNGMFHFVDWLPTIMSAAMDTPINIDDIDGVNQWETILNNRPSKRNSFIYNIDPLGSRRSYKHHCSTPTEAIRVDDWKLIRGCPGLYTGWYNLTDYEPDLSLDNLDLGIELSISHENNQTCLRKNRINPKRYFLFNLKNDPYEKENLADQMPCKVRDLEKRLDEYQSMVVLPQVKEPLHLYHDPRGDPRNTNNKFWPGWC